MASGNFTRGLNRKGNWKGGKIKSSGGYICLRSEGHPRATKQGHYVFEHVLVMEKKLRRFLKPSEIVHHKDGIRTNNLISNLELMTQADHMRQHLSEKSHFLKWWVGKKRSLADRKNISLLKKKWWEERKRRLPENAWSTK